MSETMLYIDEKYARQMTDHALEDDPNECCGILAGKNGSIDTVYRMANAEASRYRYAMDPIEYERVERDIACRGMEMMAIYHSHTHSEAYPSPTDVRLANPWLEVRYILISLLDKENPAIRAFYINSGIVTQEELRIARSV